MKGQIRQALSHSLILSSLNPRRSRPGWPTGSNSCGATRLPGPAYSMIRKSRYRFSEKVMLKQEAKAKWRFNLKSFRFSAWARPVKESKRRHCGRPKGDADVTAGATER